jgi:hypothetical protein
MRTVLSGAAALLVAGCSASMVNSPGTSSEASPFAPVNEDTRPGVVKYLNNGADFVIQQRREDAYKQMYEACGGKYRIDGEGPQVQDGVVMLLQPVERRRPRARIAQLFLGALFRPCYQASAFSGVRPCPGRPIHPLAQAPLTSLPLSTEPRSRPLASALPARPFQFRRIASDIRQFSIIGSAICGRSASPGGAGRVALLRHRTYLRRQRGLRSTRAPGSKSVSEVPVWAQPW